MATLFNGLWIQCFRGYLPHQWEILLLDTYRPVTGECLSITYEGHQTSDPDADLGVPCALGDIAGADRLVLAFKENLRREPSGRDFWRCGCQRPHFHQWSERQCPVCSDRRDHDGVVAPAIAVLKSLNGWWYREPRREEQGCHGCGLRQLTTCEHLNAGFGDAEDGGTGCRRHVWRGWWPHMDFPEVGA